MPMPPPFNRRDLELRPALILLALLMSLVSASSAQAASSLSWSAPLLIDTAEPDLSGVSCASASLCAAVDSSGNVLTATDPTGGASAWATADVDGSNFMTAVSCNASGFCVAGDSEGNIVTSTNPTGGASAWSAPVSLGGYIGSLSCPSTAFCAAVSYTGEVLTSTDPAGGASAWHSTPVDSGNRLSGVSCPSASLCVAVDQGGNEITSTNPTGGASAWSAPVEVSAFINKEREPLNAVSCASVSFCAAVDGYEYTSTVHASSGNVTTSSNPTGGAAAWSTPTQLAEGLFGVSCPMSGFCAVTDLSGNVFAASEPSGEASAWSSQHVDSSDGIFSHLTGISCPSTSLCVAVDGQGNVLTGTSSGTEEESGGGGGSSTTELVTDGGVPPPGPQPGVGNSPKATISSAQIAALLKQQLLPTGKALKIGALLKSGGLALPVSALEAGTLVVQWYELPAGAKLAKVKAKPVLVASGRLTFSGAGSGQIKLKLSASGKRLLKHAKRVKLTAEGVFVASGHAAVSTISAFTVRR
jgi:hypothetical protein